MRTTRSPDSQLLRRPPAEAQPVRQGKPSEITDGPGLPPDSPTGSVVIPVRNDPANLRLCLESLAASTFRDFETIVVDDASTIDVASVAAEFGARVLRNDTCMGPGEARNRGVRVARGAYILFLDADVCLRPESLQQFVDAFNRSPDIDAVFGSYDEEPGAGNVLSQYRNLQHHFVHQQGRDEAFTFWSGCGAIKRSIFEHVGGFDPSYNKPSIEDIELGSRLRRAGSRVVLDKSIQVRHMKEWTLWEMIRTDVQNRGIPWIRLLLREGVWPDDLNIRRSQRISVVLSVLFVVALAFAILNNFTLLVLPALAVVAVIFIDIWTRNRSVPMVSRFLAAFAGLGVLGLIVWNAIDDRSFLLWMLTALGFAVGLMLINYRLYAFYSRLRSPFFVPLVLALQITYYVYCAFALVAGTLQHLLSKRTGDLETGGSSL